MTWFNVTHVVEMVYLVRMVPLWLLLWLVSLARCQHDMIVVNTWDFQDASMAAFNALLSSATALDAVEEVRVNVRSPSVRSGRSTPKAPHDIGLQGVRALAMRWNGWVWWIT